MKILHIVTDSDPRSGGVIEAARLFAVEWASEGHQQDLLTLDAPGEIFLEDYPGNVISVGSARTRSLLSRYRYSPRMIPWLRENLSSYDVVIVSGLWRFQTLGARMALKRSKTPYVVFTHGMLDPWFRKVYPIKHLIKQISWFISEGHLLNAADAVIFTNNQEKIRSENAFFPYKLKAKVAGLGTPRPESDIDYSEMFRAYVPGLYNSPYLLFLSRIHKKKGCDLLIEAFASVADCEKDVHLVVAGPDSGGLTIKLRSIAEKMGIADRVHFPGMLEGKLKIGAYQGAMAFVLPSHQENFGIVVSEALAFGLPVLITNQVYIWEAIMDANAGLVQPDTLHGVTKLLNQWIDLSPAQVDDMKKNAFECYNRHFSIKSASQNLIKLLESLMR